MTPLAEQWYVQFNGHPYGPFSPAQMQAFVAEKRVIETSLITPDPSRGYFQASAFPLFQQWQAVVHQTSAVTPAIGHMQGVQSQQYQAAPIAVGQAYTSPPEPEPSPTVLLVMAEIRSAQGMPFLQALQSYGTAQRIGDTVWLIRTHMSADALRSELSRTLSKQDRLFILDSFNNKTAWFNIGADMDGRIRDLWDTDT